MADGDEKIDHNDRVMVLNRVSDAATAIMFDGKVLTWSPGQVRSIQRDEAPHFIAKSTVRADPTGSYFPIQRLVMIGEDKQPLEHGATTEPITEAACREFAKYGLTDTTNMPPDRMLGGQMLMDPETGEHPGRVVLKGNPQGGNLSAPPLQFAPKVADRDLDALQP